jgi:hypothetical protein
MHFLRRRGGERSLFAVAWLCAACSVYESSLFSSGAPLDGDAGKASSGGTSGAANTANDAGKSGDASHPGEAGTASLGGGGSSANTGNTSGGRVTSAGTPAMEDGAGAGGAANEVALELLDDMEDGDAFVAAGDNRNGHWDVSNDATLGASQSPTPAAFAMAELLDPSRPTSHFAAYTKGSGFKDWGAFMTVSMRTWPDYDKTPVYDASHYRGISFWCKAGVGSDLSMRLRYIGAQTDARGGQCTPGGSIDTACYDHFYADVKLSQQWQKIELMFADFHQAGVGKTFPSIDLTSMYALELFFPGRKTASGNTFELWVDDLSFIVR